MNGAVVRAGEATMKFGSIKLYAVFLGDVRPPKVLVSRISGEQASIRCSNTSMIALVRTNCTTMQPKFVNSMHPFKQIDLGIS